MNELMRRRRALMAAQKSATLPFLLPGTYDRGSSVASVTNDGSAVIEELGWGDGSNVIFLLSQPIIISSGQTITITLSLVSGNPGGYMNGRLATSDGWKTFASNAAKNKIFKVHSYTTQNDLTITGLVFGKQTGNQGAFSFTASMEV